MGYISTEELFDLDSRHLRQVFALAAKVAEETTEAEKVLGRRLDPSEIIEFDINPDWQLLIEILPVTSFTFDAKVRGVSGAIDAIQLYDKNNSVIFSIAFDGLSIADLMKVAGHPARIDALFAKRDFYDLGGGNDIVSSLGGNDEVHVGSGNNVVHAGTGNDVVSAVGAVSGDNKFHGDAGNDRMDGWNGRDMLVGGAGADTLYGWGSNDTLDGGKDADRLTGGVGADILTGGAGKDVFDFNTFDAGATKATRDTIADFHRGEDKLELAQFKIDGEFGDKLVFIGSKALTEVGQVRFEKAHGDVIAEVNYQGDKEADFAILLKDVDAIGKADLIL